MPPPPVEAKKPRLSVWERHAPPDQVCTAVYFGRAQARLVPVPLAAPNRFKTSQADTLCGLLLRIELGEVETYATVNLETLAGRLVGIMHPPPLLSGRRLVTGRHDWPVDLPHGTGEGVRYRLSLTTSTSLIRYRTQPETGKTISLEHEVRR